MLILERADVVRLAVIVPGKDFDHGETLLDDFIPAVEDERTTWKDPVLGGVS
jgi:hypothetical protein